MKTKIRQISKRSISILLSLMMFVTSFAGFGVLDVIAATVQSDSVGAESIYITYVPNTNDYINYWWFDGVNKKQMTNTSGTKYSYTFPTSGASLDANTTYRFQIMRGDKHYTGNYTSTVDGTSYTLYQRDTNESHHSVNYATGNKSTITVTFDTNGNGLTFTSSNTSGDEKYYVVGSAVNNDTSWSTFTELPGSDGTYKKSFANATELASGKDFIVTSAQATSSNVKPTVSNGTGISFTGGGTSNIKFSFSSNYTYPVTLTYTKLNNTLTGTATSNVKPVATSVSLAASPSPAETNNPITLTAALSGKASGLGNVTYTFTETSGKGGTFSNATQTTSATSATATFTPSGTGSYTFKVVASATGYTAVEKTVTVNVTSPPVYYIQGRFRVKSSATATGYTTTFTSGNWSTGSTQIKFTKVADDDYQLNTYCTLKELSEQIKGIDGYTGDPFLFITQGTETDAGTTRYYAQSSTAFSLSNKSVTLKTSDGADNNLRFNDSSDRGPVTLKFKPSTGELSFEVPTLVKYTATVNANEGGTITAPAGGSAEVESGKELTITAVPDNGFKFKEWTPNPNTSAGFANADAAKSANTKVTINGNVTLTASFALQNPSVSLNAGANTANIGNSVTLTPSVTKYDDITYSEPTFTVKKGSTTLTASDYIKGSSASGYTFSTPTDKDAKGTYTITVSYTASKTGFTDASTSAAVTITVSPSDYQTAYETIVSNLSDTTNYPIPSTISGEYKKSTYDAYNAAYTAASNAVNGTSYPAAAKGASDPDYVKLSADLINAKAALVAKQTLPQPTLSADPAIITSGTYSTLTISNYAQYPDGTVFEFYKTTDTSAAIATVTKTASNTGTTAISGTTLDLGTHSYYVKVKSYNTDDYICSNTQSANVSIEKKTGITVSVNAGANGSAYISKYTDLSGKVVNNTDPSLTSVSALSGNSVTFTAVPDANYEVSKWNGADNTSKTYTLSNVTANTDVSVEFAESKDVYFYIAVSHNWDTNDHPDVAYASKVGTSYIYEKSLYNGTSEINGIDKKFKVYIYKAVEGTSVRIGASNYGQTVTPKSGDCYYYGSIYDNSQSKYADGRGTINAMTLTDVKATSSVAALVKGSQVNLSVTASNHNGKTAGQDSYTVHYKVTKDGNVVHSGTTASFTPSESGSYVVEAYAVDNTSGKISTNTVKKTIEVYDSLPSFKVEFGSSNDTMGTVTATAGGKAIKSGDTVVAGTQVSFSYDIKDTSKYDFLGWYDNPQGTGNALASYKPYAFNIKGNTKVYAVFGGKASNYRLVKKDGSTYTSLGTFRATDNDNEYVLSINLNEGDKFNFYIETSAGTPSPNYADKSGDYFQSSHLGTGNSLAMYHWDGSAPCPEFESLATGTYVFTWNLNKDNGGTLSVERPASDRIKVYAKDGTIRANYQKYADMADTKLTSGVTGRDSTPAYYETARAKKGGTITIQTTIDSAYRSKYYVKAFCINGESYGIITKSDAESLKSNGVYTCTYAIPDMDAFEGDKLEITPIYYYFDDEDTVTFYVEGRTEELADVAGDTLAVYAFYQGGGDEKVEFNAENMQAFGGYPGQPLVKDGGRFYMQVPKHLNGDESHPISGITLNNYVWDDIHKGRVNGGEDANMQTYDYNCFLRINEVKKARDIFFDFKYRNGGNNVITNIGNTFPGENNSNFKNGWENLTNHLGGLVDIYNDNISGSTDGKEPLHVVSNGYIANGSQTYATEWNVYAPGDDGELLGAISPTALLAENADGIIYGTKIEQYKATYNALEQYKGYPVRITYEKAMKNDEGKVDGGSTGGEQALRIDGRWTYVTTDDFAEGNVEIQYADTLNDEFVTDPFTEGTNQGSITKTRAYFTNEEFYHETTSGSIQVNPDEYFTFAAETDPDNQYMFVGWWKRSVDGTYVPMNEAHSHMVGNDTFVARFIKTPDGNLSVKHQLYNSDSPVVENMPQIYGGQGNCYVKVEIMDGDTVIETFGNTTSATSVSIDQKYIRADSTYKMRITLTTVMKGKNIFEDIYRRTERIPAYTSVKTAKSDEDGISTVISGNVATTVRYYPIDRLFKDSDGNLQDVQIVKTANYYSSIKTVNRPYKITFNYNDRIGAPQKYVVKGGLPEGQTELTKEYVMSKAPYEKNFMQDFVWDDSSITIIDVGDTSTAEVYSTQTASKVAVHYNTAFLTDGAYDATYTFNYGSLVTVDGKRLNAPETNPQNANEKFSHWVVTTDEGEFVTNVYSRWFNYILYDNYFIKPIYKEKPDSITESGISATIQFLEYSRNQWTDDNGNKDATKDRIFADFALSFTKNGELIDPSQNECGIVLAVGPNIDGKTPDNVTFTTDEAKLKDFIKNGTAYTSDGANGTAKAVKSSTMDGVDDKYNLDNKNRVELYNRFKNLSANTAPVIKAYSYIIDDNGEVVLSDPVYIRLYEESIKTYTYNADNAA